MDKEKELKTRAANTLTNVVKDSDNESDLKQSYINYKSQSRKKQREADWEMQAAYGITNQDRYEELESDFLKQDLDDDHATSYDGTGSVGHFEEDIQESYIFEMLDDTAFEDVVTEASKDNKLYPVYVMLMHSGTLLSTAISAVTGSKFSHSSVSFDASMKHMYSFGRKFDTNPFIGAFKTEDITGPFFEDRVVPYALYVVPCTKHEVDLMKKRLDYFIKNSTKFKYDFTGLLKNYFGIKDNPEYKWFCSRFVSDIINSGRPKSDPYVKEPSLMRPEDFTHTNFAVYVTGGLLSEYDEELVVKETDRILKEETKKRKVLVKEEAEDNYKVNFDHIDYPNSAILVARDWANNNMRAIITPANSLEDLEDQWIKYKSMIRKHQRESDWKSEELFGVNNQTHYEYLKSKYIKADIQDDPEDIVEPSISTPEDSIEYECRLLKSIDNPIILAEKCLDLHNRPDKSYYEEVLVKSYIDNNIEYYKDNIGQTTNMPLNDLPFFDPEEMMDLGVFDRNYYDTPVSDNPELAPGITVEQWFNNYKLLFDGITNEDTVRYNRMRVNKLKEFYLDYDRIKESGNINMINARKQRILELGWNPEIDFSVRNRLMANNRIKNILDEKYNLKIINSENVVSTIRESENTSTDFVYLAAISEKDELNLCLSYDASFKEMYKYNTKLANGLVRYSLKNFNREDRMIVFGAVVKEKDLQTIKQLIAHYSDSNSPILYKFDDVVSYNLGIIVAAFMNKLMDNSATGHMYKLYDGTINEYKYGKLNSYMASLNSFETVNEEYSSKDETSVKIYDNLIRPYLELHYINEAKEFPIQFDKDGNLLIKSMKKIDFEAEFAKSHKLLLQYENANNIEGIKYELSKLWFMNSLLESKIYKTKADKRSDLHKARAKILNDFKKYLDLVLAEDGDFNFTEYFDNSPYSDAVYKLSKHTLKYTASTIKDIILNIAK